MTTFASPSLDALKRTHDELVGILDAYREAQANARNAIRVPLNPAPDSLRYAREQLAAQLVKEKATALVEVAASRERAEQQLTKARAEVKAALGRPPTDDPTLQLLNELREERAWNRAKARLDATDSPTSDIRAITAEASTAGDLDTLVALRAEMPAYLTSRDQAHALPLALAEFNAGSATASPIVKAALDAQSELDTGWDRLGVAYAHATYALQTDAERVSIADWDGDAAEVQMLAETQL